MRAVDHLEEQGLQRAALALCKKILRNAPARADAYLRAGRLQARVGLQAEARESHVEFQEFAELSGEEEEEALGAYRQLGQALRSRMDGFRLRFVEPAPSAPPAANVTVEERPVAAARS